MNKAKANPAKLVPLKEQAMLQIRQAEGRLITQTRAGSARRRIMQGKINLAWKEYRAGNYAEARGIARTAHI